MGVWMVSYTEFNGWQEESIINPVFLVVYILVSRANRNPRHSRDGIRQPYPDVEYRHHSNALTEFSAFLHERRAWIGIDFVLPSVL